MLSPQIVFITLLLYFIFLLTVAYLTSKNVTTDDFFTANKQSPWYLVAFGMIGTSISGVTFISVPGKVGVDGFSYLQMVMGYVAGYVVIANVLMPLYYRMNLISIYTYLEHRFGTVSYKTGAAFFLISRSIGSSLRLYLAAEVLQLFLFDAMHIPFSVTVLVTIVLIWVYTYKGGIKTIIWTDSFQTLFLIGALVISVILITKEMNWGLGEMVSQVWESKYSSIFVWNASAKNFFFKHFISGMFITIVMTGLDQDLMQKNLTCKSLADAKKNMFWFTIVMVAVNILFVTLGALLYMYCTNKGIDLPSKSDQLYPLLAMNNLGLLVGLFFLVGIIASSYASADSALASLTTSFCIDFLDFKNKEEKVKLKQKFSVHIGFSLVLFVLINIFHWANDSSVIDAVFTLAGYTYGPLLGLFAYGILSKRVLADKLVPVITLISPLITFFIVNNSADLFNGYKIGFELLLINALFCYIGFYISSLFVKASK